MFLDIKQLAENEEQYKNELLDNINKKNDL